MFAFTEKPQSLLELISNGLKLFGMSFSKVWHWSLMIALFFIVYPYYVHRKSIEVFTGITHSQALAVILAWLIITPALVFLAGILVRRIYVAGAKKKESLVKSSHVVIKKVFVLYAAMILFTTFTTIGFYLMLIPGLFVVVLFIFVIPLILIDDKKLWDAFKTSSYLVWGNWWRIFMIVFVPLVLMSVVTYATAYIMGPAMYALQVLAIWILTPLFYSMVLNGFSDAKIRHEMKPLHTNLSKKKKTTKAKPTKK